MVNILSDQDLLQKYSEKRIRHCEEKIEQLKRLSIFMMELFSINEADVNLPIPTREGFPFWASRCRPMDHHWMEFPWDQFMKTDFFQKSKVSNDNKREVFLKRFEVIRTQMRCLSHQKILLSNDEGRLEAVKTIAKMSLIKHSFMRERLKNCAIFYAVCLLPAGAFFADWKTDDQSTYEKNREFLPDVDGFQEYQDLLDAHNQLIRNNDFIVPYMIRPLLRE